MRDISKKFLIAVTSLFLMLGNIVPIESIIAVTQQQENRDINVTLEQEYNEEENTVIVKVNATPNEQFEIVGFTFQEQRNNEISPTYQISKNGEYTFTVHYKEVVLDATTEIAEEKSADFVKKVTSIKELEVEEKVKEEIEIDTSELESTLDQINSKLNKEEPKSKKELTKNGETSSVYFIFGKPNTITSYASIEGAPKDIVIPRTYIDENDVEQEVLYIANNAFAGQQLTSVVINDNLKTIGKQAFYNNVRLTDVIIPDSVESIGDSAFMRCISLSNVNLGKGFNTIGTAAFVECTSLTKITIPGSVKTIGANSFERCSSLTTVVLEPGVETIGNNAFNNTGIEQIELPEGLKSIGDRAFSYTKLTSIVIPDSVKGFFGADSIFYYSKSLKDITFGSGFTQVTKPFYIATNPIFRVPSKEACDLPGLNYWDNVYWKSSDNSCFYENKGIIYGFKQLDHETHTNCLQGDDHTYANIDNDLFTRTVTTINTDAFSGNKELISVNLPETTEIIMGSAFYRVGTLKTINLPNPLHTIGSNAFRETGIETAIIPEKVSVIEPYTFSDCTRLTSLIIGDNVKIIGNRAFYRTVTLSHVTMGESVEIIDEFAFAYSGLTKLDITDSVKTISNNSFKECSKLKELNLGSGVESIGSVAFYRSGIEELIIPDNVKTIGSESFGISPNLKKVTIGSGLSKIAYGSFSSCPINELKLSEGLETIGTSAFNRIKLQKLKLPNSLETIENSAFNEGLLESVEYGSNITSIGVEAFKENKIKTIVLPDSLKNIGDRAFRDNRELVDITIGSGLETLPSELLLNVADGIKIRIPSKYVNGILGTPWSAINAEIYWKSDDASCYYEKDGIVYGFKPLDHESHTDCRQNNDHTYVDLSGDHFSQPVTRIEDGAFVNNTKITKVTLSDDMKEIGATAFAGCTKLNKVELNEGLTSIGESAFKNASLQGQLTIPDSVTSIGLNAFQNTKLNDVTIGSGIQELGSIFSGVGVIKIRIPSKEVEEIAGAPWGANSNRTNLYWKSNDDSCLYIRDGNSRNGVQLSIKWMKYMKVRHL